MGRCRSCLCGALEPLPLPLGVIRDILCGEGDASQSLGLEKAGRGIPNRLPFNFSWFSSRPSFLFCSSNSNLRKPAAWAPVGENTRVTAAGRGTGPTVHGRAKRVPRYSPEFSNPSYDPSLHSQSKDVNAKPWFLPVLIRKTSECRSLIKKILKFQSYHRRNIIQ